MMEPFVDVFCTRKNRVVKITHSSFEMVLRTTKHTMTSYIYIWVKIMWPVGLQTGKVSL
jgi:hypothetical protein